MRFRCSREDDDGAVAIVSLLLVDLPDTLAVKLIQRLVAQGDEVRVLVERRAPSDVWRDLGAHVAFGSPADEDLVWRAATGVRTAVLGDLNDGQGALPAFASGAERAGVERVVVCSPQPPPWFVATLDETELQYVVLTSAKKPLVGRAKSRIAASKLAEAIDAADDLPGRLRLELDLTVERSWQILKVLPPEG